MITSPILPLFRSKWLIQTTIFELCQVLSASAIAARSWLKCNPWGNIRPLKELFLPLTGSDWSVWQTSLMERIATEKYKLFIYFSLDHGLFTIVSNQRSCPLKWLQKKPVLPALLSPIPLTFPLFLSCKTQPLRNFSFSESWLGTTDRVAKGKVESCIFL